MKNHLAVVPRLALLASLLNSGTVFLPSGFAQGQVEPQNTTSTEVPATPVTPSTHHDSRSQRAAMMYRALWGIEDLRAQLTSSGALVRLSYRIFDQRKAAALNDDKNTPYLIVQKTGAKLEVPTTEKVGTLRQTARPENGREYWMVFTNSARMVNAGDRVDIQIGRFRANGVTVESPQATPAAVPPAKASPAAAPPATASPATAPSAKKTRGGKKQ